MIDMKFNLPTRVDKISILKDEYSIEIKRDDLIHAEVSGNKWRKLKLYIELFKSKKYNSLITFGGAFSNHIAATAATGRLLGIPTIGIIRGDELNPSSNSTLEKAEQDGMKLVFVSREEYRERNQQGYKLGLREKFGNALVVPEGGAGFYGVMGCTEIIQELDNAPDFLVVSAGTGTTLSGLLLAKPKKTKIIVYPALKGGDFLKEEVLNSLVISGLDKEGAMELLDDVYWKTEYHFGGYGKIDTALIEFLNQFWNEHQIPLDPVYTGKAMYGLINDLKEEQLNVSPKDRITFIHTGGVQGLLSIQSQLTNGLKDYLLKL